jgi:hypothetical protein
MILKKDEIRVWLDVERSDWMIEYGSGTDLADAKLIMLMLREGGLIGQRLEINGDIAKELINRGYDLSTFKLSIRKNNDTTKPT